jgi:hypothetical protein
MNNLTINEKTEHQMSIFDVLGIKLEDEDLPEIKKPKRSYTRRLKVLQEQMEFMLAILDTPDDIGDVPIDWTDEDIEGIRHYMIVRHFRYILDGRSKISAAEAWAWILSEEVHPFSFRVCLDSVLESLGLVIDGKTSIDRSDVREALYARSFFAEKQKENEKKRKAA